MVYLLCGADTYRSRQKLKEIIKESLSKEAAGLHKFDAEDSNDRTSQVLHCLGARPLFGGKKTVVIENFSKFLDLEGLLSKLKSVENSEDTTVVLWDRDIPADTISKFKKLSVKAQEFKNLSGAQLKNWITEEAKKRGLRLFPAHWERLGVLRSDLWAVSGELDKMSVEEDASYKLQVTSYKTIFDLGDTFFTNKKAAMQILLQILHQGEDEFRVFSYLTNHCRNMLLVKDHLERKQPISSDYKIHHFVIKKITSAVKNMPTEKLKKTFKRFFEEDWRIKTGLSKPSESLEKILYDL